MPHHVMIHLPDGRVACADCRDPIVRQMRKINDALLNGRMPALPLYEPVTAWLDQHREQSAVCHAALTPSALPCGHD